MLLIPLDNRPVCYDLPLQIAKSGGLTLHVPPKEILGGLDYQADFNALKEWTLQTVRTKRVTKAVVALDTIAYGGLIPSRWSEDYYDDIIDRINEFMQIFKVHNVNVFGFSSIMRISNNNYNEEEKDYWADYGKLIYKYSNLSHKVKKLENPLHEEQLYQVIQEIPQEILEDYVSARERNFAVNQHILNVHKNNGFEWLVLCQDDCSKWGINVLEADELKNQVLQNKLQNKTIVHPGSDEVAACLIVRAHMWPNSFSVYPVYTLEKGKEIIANYEDRPIKKSVEGHIKLIGAKKANSIGSSDLVLVIHLPEIYQGDHIWGEEPEGTSPDAITKAVGLVQSLKKPVAIADILWANGADPDLIEGLIQPNVDISYLYSYSGWNTAGNTIGSALAIALIKIIAEKSQTTNNLVHKRLVISRLAEDWAYQSKIRKLLKEPDVVELNNRMFKEMEPILKKFNYQGEISFKFPWNRLFEIEALIK